MEVSSNISLLLLILKIILILVTLLTNFTLFLKIIAKPSIHTIFNVSVACLFGLTAVFGPFVINFYFDIFENQVSHLEQHAKKSADCARLMEFRNVIGESFKIIGVNLMFRFFFVVHAEKGLHMKERSDSTLIQTLYVICTVCWTVSGYLSWPGTVMFSEDYPDNTVRGRICLSHRLDWDQNKRSKETSDIYVKPRLVVLALTMIGGLMMFYLVHRVNIFIHKFCSSNSSHACIGGRYRRNILTFKELSIIHAFIILFFFWDSLLIFSFYFLQDQVGSDAIFFFYHGTNAMFDMTCIILLPSFVLIRSLKNYPALWTDYAPKKLTFYATSLGLVPRRETLYTLDGDQETRRNQFQKEEMTLRESFQDRKMRKQKHFLWNPNTEFVTVDVH